MNKIRFISFTLFILFILTNVNILFGQENNKQFQVVFEGNRIFTSEELRNAFNKCDLNLEELDEFDDDDVLLSEFYDCTNDFVILFLQNNGYANASFGELSLKRNKNEAFITIPLNEGLNYRFGNISVEGLNVIPNTFFEETFPIKSGEIADFKIIEHWITLELRKNLTDAGFKLPVLELEPRFRRLDKRSGIVDFKLFVNEGNSFTIKDIYFLGNKQTRIIKLLIPLGLNEHDIFTEERLKNAVTRLNEASLMKTVEYNKDVDIKYDYAKQRVNILIKIQEKDKK